MSHSLHCAVESGQEARIVQIDFRAAFDSVNHLSILYKLCSVVIEGSALSILTQFLSNRSQHGMVDACRSKVFMLCQECRFFGQCFGKLLFLLYTSVLFSILENKLIAYADDST